MTDYSGPIDQVLHGIELVIVLIVIPTARSLINTIISLRDSVRELVTTTAVLGEAKGDHELRIRALERAILGMPRSRVEDIV